MSLGKLNNARESLAIARECRGILGGNFLFVSSAIRTELLRSIGGFDESIREQGEYEGWVRLLLAGARAGIVREPLANYLVRSDSLSADPTYNRRHAIHALNAALSLSLTEVERSVARAKLAELEAIDLKARTVVAMRHGESGARRLALRAALVRPSRPGSRLKFAALAIAPRAVARRA